MSIEFANTEHTTRYHHPVMPQNNEKHQVSQFCSLHANIVHDTADEDKFHSLVNMTDVLLTKVPHPPSYRLC
jgi:hypothetical protein